MDFSSTASTWIASSMDNSTFRRSATLASSHMAKIISKVKQRGVIVQASSQLQISPYNS